jgi:hypothetical protein
LRPLLAQFLGVAVLEAEVAAPFQLQLPEAMQ